MAKVSSAKDNPCLSLSALDVQFREALMQVLKSLWVGSFSCKHLSVEANGMLLDLSRVCEHLARWG